MKKVQKVRIISAAAFLSLYGWSVYMAFFAPPNPSFARGRLQGVLIAVTATVLALLAWVVIRISREEHSLKTGLKAAADAILAILSAPAYIFKKRKK